MMIMICLSRWWCSCYACDWCNHNTGVLHVRCRWSCPSVLSVSYSSPRRPWSRGQRHFHSGSPSLASVVFSASPPLFRRARALASQRLRPSDSVQRSASFPATPSSSWLRLPSLGKPALSSPSRAYLAGAPPWSSVSWPGLYSPPFLFVLVPKAPLSRVDARPSPLSSGLRPETPAVGRTPSPCRHLRGRGTKGSVQLGFLVPIGAEWSEEHDGALGHRRDLAVDENFDGQVAPLLSGHWRVGSVNLRGPPASLPFSFVWFRVCAVFAKIISLVSVIQKLWNKFCDVPWDG